MSLVSHVMRLAKSKCHDKRNIELKCHAFHQPWLCVAMTTDKKVSDDENEEEDEKKEKDMAEGDGVGGEELSCVRLPSTLVNVVFGRALRRHYECCQSELV